jgi:hypothetical protein
LRKPNILERYGGVRGIVWLIICGVLINIIVLAPSVSLINAH